MNTPRIRDAGDSALLLELDAVIDPGVNAHAVAIAARLQRERLAGVRDVIPTYRSVAVHFDPLAADTDALRSALLRGIAEKGEPVLGRTVEVPTTYGGEAGPDLADVAAWSGLTPDAVVEHHARRPYRVFMLGFLPGFAYLGSVAGRIAAPRRAVPRQRVPAGSVGIAGGQTGVYPRESPGGWQIIGRTALRLFDPDRVPAALLQPGDTVVFVPDGGAGEARDERSSADSVSLRQPRRSSRTVTVLRPGLFTTIQDAGRWGHQSSGVPVSGALDRISYRTANALAGNPGDAAALEVTLVGPELRFEQGARVAVAGADLAAYLDGVPVPPAAAMTCRAGSVLRFGERRRGARAYVAFDGGIDAAPVLGSRATHAGAALGGLEGRALAAGDRLPLGSALAPDGPRAALPRLDAPGGGVRLRILPGPQDDFFPEAALDVLERGRYTVTPQSNRMGYRLTGPHLPRLEGREMISDAAFTGGIQVPPSGEPILLMHDRQTTGGYPQIATVITADLPLAGQLAPGDWVEFERCSRADAIIALTAQEATLRALG